MTPSQLLVLGFFFCLKINLVDDQVIVREPLVLRPSVVGMSVEALAFLWEDEGTG